ncbi:MAG: 5-formyltetrahydrofolate cyclo-ligase [Lachnospiraceae bacterium]|jgi:5-formyltetrahydrofolate cyclo-ligase|nr:5-formyltetrahydrofolate cyclo-ligase [Lachnospiraceae bacterium]
MDTIPTNKKSLRKEYLIVRDALSASARKEKSRAIIDRLTSTKTFLDAEIVLTYLNFGSEVITDSLVSRLLSTKEKMVFCPRINGDQMDFYQITSLDQLVEGYWSIREPMPLPGRKFDMTTCLRYQCINIMPGTVFDQNCGRIGYGRGYYDRFLVAYALVPTVALAFDCQFAPAVPTEATDICPDMIITESAIITNNN